MQFVIVIAIIAAALAYAGVIVLRKRRAFSPRSGCGSDDCGCNGGSK